MILADLGVVSRIPLKKRGGYVQWTHQDKRAASLGKTEISNFFQRRVRMNENLPIRAKPYAHQVEAYRFACRLFGLDGGGDAVPVSRGVAYLMEMG